MKKILLASTIAILSTTTFASLSVNDGLSSCRFSNSDAAINYARALDGDTNAAGRLLRSDLAQVEACSTAMTQAIARGSSYKDLAKIVNTNFSHIKNGMELTVELRGKDLYKLSKEDKSLFKGTTSTLEGDFDMIVSVEGSRNEISQGFPTQTTPHNMRLEVVSKNQVRIIEEASNINVVVKAEVKKSVFGKVKKINISSAEVERALAPFLQSEGLDLAKNFEMNTEEGSFTMDYEVSDMNCSYNKSDDFECSSSFIFQFSVKFQ